MSRREGQCRDDETLTLAIDPGAKGALAAFYGGEAFMLVDLPYLAKQLEPALLFESLLSDLLAYRDAATIVLEKQQYMPLAQGVPGGKGLYQKGENYGLLLGYCKCLQRLYKCPIVQPTPQRWKKAMGLTSDKALSLRTARERFPGLAPQLTRQKDEGRAEALLLGIYYHQHVAHTGGAHATTGQS